MDTLAVGNVMDVASSETDSLASSHGVEPGPYAEDSSSSLFTVSCLISLMFIVML